MTVLFPLESLSPLLQEKKPVVFLDSARPDAGNRCSYLFHEPIRIVRTNVFSEVPRILDEVEKQAKHHWLAGYIAYEAAYGLEEKLQETIPCPPRCNFNLVWFGVYERPFQFDHVRGRWNPSYPYAQKSLRHKRPPKENDNNVITKRTFSLTYKKYAKAIRAIKRWIARGHTYQTNFTFNAHIATHFPPHELYSFLRAHQRTPYGAYVSTGDEEILSFSPELFFKRTGSHIVVKPMKGTAPRGRWDEEDGIVKKELHYDSKNRSENIMIVDLLRNDLGRICKTGSIRPHNLFSVETHPTLHQMTSTIQGVLRPQVGYRDIFKHIFPSGSVTGAPKIRTMEIIHALEHGKRRVYCGALGYISPHRHAVFSVPIRILQKQKNAKEWTYRVGSGIVWDSSAQDEWQECKTKCRFLAMKPLPPFEIFETLLWDKHFTFLKEHRQRLKKTATFFAFPYSSTGIKHLLNTIRAALCDKGKRRVRIFLDKKGVLRWDSFPLPDIPEEKSTLVILARKAINENNIFLYHKTTYRPWYKTAMERIKKGSCFDVVFMNSHGFITEGARTNIFIKEKNTLYTPPLDCGLLPGILRQHLIRTGKCFEKAYTLSSLRHAAAIYCGNSVRGLHKITLQGTKERKNNK